MKTTPTYLIYLFEYKHIIFCIKPIFLSKVKANAQWTKTTSKMWSSAAILLREEKDVAMKMAEEYLDSDPSYRFINYKIKIKSF